VPISTNCSGGNPNSGEKLSGIRWFNQAREVGRNGEEGQGNRGERNAVPERAGGSREGSGVAVSFPEKKKGAEWMVGEEEAPNRRVPPVGRKKSEGEESAGWACSLGRCLARLNRPGSAQATPFFFFFLFYSTIFSFVCLKTNLFGFWLILNIVTHLEFCQGTLANQNVLFGDFF
jgi:hypothetical protein